MSTSRWIVVAGLLAATACAAGEPAPDGEPTVDAPSFDGTQPIADLDQEGVQLTFQRTESGGVVVSGHVEMTESGASFLAALPDEPSLLELYMAASGEDELDAPDILQHSHYLTRERAPLLRPVVLRKSASIWNYQGNYPTCSTSVTTPIVRQMVATLPWTVDVWERQTGPTSQDMWQLAGAGNPVTGGGLYAGKTDRIAMVSCSPSGVVANGLRYGTPEEPEYIWHYTTPGKISILMAESFSNVPFGQLVAFESYPLGSSQRINSMRARSIPNIQ